MPKSLIALMNEITTGNTKELLLLGLAILLSLVLVHGNEMGTFYNTGKSDAVLWPVSFVISFITLLLCFRKRGINRSAKCKAGGITILVILSFLPMFLLSGFAHYIDYYTTEKQWTPVTVVIAGKESRSAKGHITYSYRLRSSDTS